MAKKTLSKLDSLPFEYHFLTTINYTKTSLSHRLKDDIYTHIEKVADE
jgi:hypothetical protein